MTATRHQQPPDDAHRSPARVGIVIPFFNAAATLPETLASIRAQTYRSLTVTIVDDGSTDPAAQSCLAALPPEITIVRQANLGLSAARNTGIRASSSELVLPLDSDDLIEPTCIEKLVAALDRSADIDLAFSWTRRFGEESGLSQMALHPVEQLFVNEAPYCMLMRRALIERAGGYDETMRDGYEDWEFNIRLTALEVRAAVVPEPLFVYRVRAQGMLRAHTMRRHVEIWRAIRRKHRALYSLRGLTRAWRRARGQRPIWPLPALIAWGALLTFCPARLINPAYRTMLRLTRHWRDRYKARTHGSAGFSSG